MALAPEPLAPRIIEPGLGATEILPEEVTANRRHAVVLCALAAVLPAVVIGVVLGVAVSLVIGAVALVVLEVALGYALWRVAPGVALRQVGAVRLSERENPRLFNVTEGLCATFGLRMPELYVVYDNVPNACALGRDAASGALVVTTGLLEMMGPIELEGVVAHELAHVKRDDNGVAVIGLTLARFGGSRMVAPVCRREQGVPGGHRRCLRRALPPGAPRCLAPHGAGPAPVGQFDLQPGSVPVHPLRLDRSFRGPAGPGGGDGGPRCHVGAGRRTGRVVRRGGPPS